MLGFVTCIYVFQNSASLRSKVIQIIAAFC